MVTILAIGIDFNAVVTKPPSERCQPPEIAISLHLLDLLCRQGRLLHARHGAMQFVTELNVAGGRKKSVQNFHWGCLFSFKPLTLHELQEILPRKNAPWGLDCGWGRQQRTMLRTPPLPSYLQLTFESGDPAVISLGNA